MFCNKNYYYANEKIEVNLKLNPQFKSKNFKSVFTIHDFNHQKVGTIITDIKYFPQHNNSKEQYYKYSTTHKGSFSIDSLNLQSNVYYVKYENMKYPITILTKEQKDIIVVFPINTIQAYNKAGRKNLYHSFYSEHSADSHTHRATKVTFKRPIEPTSQIFLFEDEFIKWFQDKNYNMKYITDHQLEDITEFDNSKLLIIIGHNEYITRKAIENMTHYVNSGKNMLVLSGNTFWWQVRYEDDMNTLVCYKKNDPIEDENLKTFNLPNQIDIYGLIGLDFRLGGYGRHRTKTYKQYCQIKNLSFNGKLLETPIDYSKIKSGDNKLIFNNHKCIPGFGGIKILEDHILFKDIVKKDEVLKISSAESDGFKVTSFTDNKLLYDQSDFYRYKVLGYDLLWRAGLTIAGFIACQKTETSGIVINTGTTDWCSKMGMGGPSSKQIKNLTKNMIDTLILKKDDIINKIF